MGAGGAPLGRLALWTGGALVLSLGLVWFATHNFALTASFAGGVLALVGALIGLALRPVREGATGFAEPDWSVTVAAIEHGQDGVAIIDRAGRLVCANGAYATNFGHVSPAALGWDGAEAALRQVWRDGAAGPGSVALTGQVWRVELTRAGRSEDYVICRMEPVLAPDPVVELSGHLAGKLGRVLTQAGFCAALVGTDGRIIAANAAFGQRAGADVLGAEFVSLFAQDDGERIYWLRDTRNAAPLTLFYLPLSDPDTAQVADPQTSPSLMLLVDQGVGVGGGKEVSAAVPHLEALLAQLPLGLAMADRDGRILFANAAFMRAAGHEGEHPPIYPTDLVVKEDKAALSDAVRRFGQGGAASGDVAVRLAAQPDEPVSLSLAGVRGLGEAAVLLGLTDTTEEARLKRQVAQATKMQAVGQLAGGVAHDFNNVLTAIIGTCDLMLLRHTPGDSDYDDIQQIRANSNRAASLTRQLLAFSRQQTLRPQVLQLPDIVSEISQMLRRLIGEKIQFLVTHDRDLGAVRADPTQLEQVIVNLVVNARDAMQEAGLRDGTARLTLATRRVSSADVRAMRSEILPIADYTALMVQDTGGGIPPDILGKIWEPFFTTKEQGKGTGLGLSTVYGIVKQSGGFIFAENVGPQADCAAGARFVVYLPVHHGAAEVTLRPREEVAAWAGGGDVLLVEDEDSVRIVAERALSRAGYTVTCASDGEEGLEQVALRAESGAAMFDLVVSDVVMPAMDGPAMARAFRKIAPQLPVLFMSGYAEEQLRREIDIANMYFIPKPFSVSQIAGKVAEVLSKTAMRGGA
jgi:two-component system cell cycle sensor histidine kinase/response regulator CckA